MALALRNNNKNINKNINKDNNRNNKNNHRDESAAALDRVHPLSELHQLRRELDRLTDLWRGGPLGLLDAFTPVADVEETDDAYTVELELAGVQRADIDIEVSGHRLSVRGERKEKERVGILRRRDRVVGTFSYEITLPGAVVEDEVTADLADGVLTVRLPKPASERPRRIPISVRSADASPRSE